MPGHHWNREQKLAYRSGFTVARIVDEVWIAVALVCLVVIVAVQDRFTDRTFEVLFFGGFFALGGLSYAFLPRVLERVMPKELWLSLPRRRFEIDDSSGAPRTYRELFRRWFLAGHASKGG
jgi:hypothetical protein